MPIDAVFNGGIKPRSSLLQKSSDLILAVLIVAIIALMILPLPLMVLDTLLAVNMALGVTLVLMAIYVSSPLQFSVFPSVLLISTLFRLALSVATTRMILLNGDAGSIIDTFGELVAGGNLVVGLVVFLIITLVQFLVIAKGAERVAEVGARFTLDAMPGKQMSIDSDLRSGLIDKVEARNKREEIALESKLHGSMDGAMKFVKGDAIAGIVIILVNLLGGLAIGVFQLGMSSGEAMSRYSILTIGDGMVAQIPALFGAMSAGLIVTRVTADNTDEHLGNSILSQFSSIPRVLLVAGAICVLFALVPGFPSTVFFGLGLVLVFCGAMLVPVLKIRMQKLTPQRFQSALQNNTLAQDEVLEAGADRGITHATPLLLELPAIYAQRAGFDIELHEKVGNALAEYQRKSGVQVPPITFHWNPDSKTSWTLCIFEVPVGDGEMSVNNTSMSLVDDITACLVKHGYLFMGIQETSALLTRVSEDYPDIVKETLRSIPLQNMAIIFKNLVAEDVPLRNVRAILEGLINASQNEKDVNNLTEFARIALSRELCHRYSTAGKLRAVALCPKLEDYLKQALSGSAGADGLALDPEKLKKIKDQLVNVLNDFKPDALITPVQIRKSCKELLAMSDVNTVVLSYSELVPTLDLDIVERVEIAL